MNLQRMLDCSSQFFYIKTDKVFFYIGGIARIKVVLYIASPLNIRTKKDILYLL